MTENGFPDPRPLHERVEEERKRRGWTQEQMAVRAKVPLRTYSSFETGKTNPQGANKRKILRALDMTDPDTETREETLASWPPDIEVFLDMEGAFLSTMSEGDRLAYMHDATRRIIAYRKR